MVQQAPGLITVLSTGANVVATCNDPLHEPTLDLTKELSNALTVWEEVTRIVLGETV